LRLYKIKAVVWLHILRLWRYKVSFLNMALSITLWILLFLLGALMFAPKGELFKAIPIVFWGIIMWNLMSNTISLISGWTWYYLSQGFVEEHILTDTSPFLVLVGRPITGLFLSALAIIFIYITLSGFEGSPIITIMDPFTLMLGISTLTLMSISVGLILAALSFKTGIQQMLIEMLNFIILIAGGLMAPLSKLPRFLTYIAILIPFSHSAELVRFGAAGIRPWASLAVIVPLSLILTASLLAISILTIKRIEMHIRVSGLRAIGRM